MASTYTLISSNVLSSSAASITFSAIPSTYTDLVLRVSSRNNDAGFSEGVRIQFNSDTTTKYSYTYLLGSNNTAFSGRASSVTYAEARQNGNAATSNTFSNAEIYIPSYTAAQAKPFSAISAVENNSATDNYLLADAELYNSTTAISSIKIYNSGVIVFSSDSSFYLYGIKNS